MFSIKFFNIYFYWMKYFIIITDTYFLFALKKHFVHRLEGTFRIWEKVPSYIFLLAVGNSSFYFYVQITPGNTFHLPTSHPPYFIIPYFLLIFKSPKVWTMIKVEEVSSGLVFGGITGFVLHRLPQHENDHRTTLG